MKQTAVLCVAGLTLASLMVSVNLVPEVASSSKLEQLTRNSEEPKPEHPAEAAAHWAGLHETPAGENSARLNYMAMQEIKLGHQLRGLGVATVPNFQFGEVGPGYFGGRLRGLVVNSNDPDTLLIGSVSGGIWKSEDGGQSWQATDDFLESLAVGSMIVDPDEANRVFVGSGEGFFNVDAARGIGIFQSDDFGDTWTQLAATDNSDFHYVNRLGAIPGSNILLAATRTGIFRSTDLGTSWSEVSGFTASGRGFVDLRVDPSDTTRIYAYHYGGSEATRRVWRSLDSGASWSELGASQGIPTTNISRMEIAVGSDGVVYLAVSNAANATRGLYRSPVGGNGFAQTASSTPFIERQGWYDLVCAVDPSDSDRVYMAAVDMYRTTDAGATITKQTQWNPTAGALDEWVHADHHVLTFHPTDPLTFWIGSDGGIFKTTDGGDTFVPLNNNIRVTQYYGIAPHPDGSSVIGGTQDNGSHLFFGDQNIWLQWFSGDGGFSSWDAQDPNYIYGSLPFAGLFGSSDGGSSSVQITLPNTTGAQFINPFTLDPNDGSRMIVGTDNIFLSENVRLLDSSTWTDASSPSALGGQVSATTISPLSGAVAYAGTSSGRIWETTGLGSGGSWTRVDTGLPTSDVTWVEVDTNDGTGDTLYATFADYGPNRIWRSTDGGGSWESISGDLPDVPLFSVRVDPTDPDRLFLGSELGLWTTDSNDGGTPGASFDWEQYDYGTAFTRVMQLYWTGDDTLWIGTHGRSIYKAMRQPTSAVAGAVDDTGCDDDGFIDLWETVTLPVTVTNDGGFTLETVTLSMSTSYAGLMVDSGALPISDLAPGASDTVDFQLTLESLGSCLDIADLEVTVDYTGGSDVHPFQQILGVTPTIQSGTLTEDAENEMASLFTHEAAFGDDDWATTTSQANSGVRSWFAADIPSLADKSLLSPWLNVQGGTTVLDFALYYDMEGDSTQYWDGVLLELRTKGGEWVDIGVLSTVPYDGRLFTNNTAPGRAAWSGTQTTWRQATVDLGTQYNGEVIQFRFRMVCDQLAANVGFWLDDISVTNVEWVESLDCDESICGSIFIDGFESGDTGAWSNTTQ